MVTAGLVAPLPAAWAGAAAPAAAGAGTGELGFQATGYGTSVTVGTLVRSGRSALSTLGCTSATGVTRTNTAAAVNAGVLSSGTIDTSAASKTTATGAAATGSSTIQHVSLLGGLVTADAVKSVSTTSRDSSTGTLSTSAAGTQFAHLSILGLPISLNPAPNTKISLPGVGYVVLNQQSGHVSKTTAGLTVIGIHIVVTLSTPLADTGTNVVVGYAGSGLGGPVMGLLSGGSYGASASILGTTVLAGKLFPQPLGCAGTAGVTKTSSGAALSVPPLLTAGAVTDTAEGIATPSNVSATVTSTVAGLNVLAGLVTATAIKASVSAAGNPPSFTDNSQFADLAVKGFPLLSVNPAPNTKVSLLGIGTLWLHKVIKTANSIQVIMVQLTVSVPGNPLGLKTGTTVNVASATVGIK
jgi:hypothetical protein